jgi:hypothetical protein
MKRTLLVIVLSALAVGAGSRSSATRPTSPASISRSAESAPQGTPVVANPPFYARLEREFELPFHTAEWAVIAFYRQPSCVRPTFNMLDFIDAPAAFGCPLTVSGFEIFDEPSPTPPIHVNLTGGGAVPIWFFSWPELRAAMADDVVTIGELSALSSLVVGSATSFREILHPGNKLTQVAWGTLEDGRTFQVEISTVVAPTDLLRHVRIDIR